MGTWNKNRFEPSQALAMALRKEEFGETVDLLSDDPRTVKYLKGETPVSYTHLYLPRVPSIFRQKNRWIFRICPLMRI